MPNQPKTPIRSIRVPDDIWLPARALAAELGDTLTDVIRKALAAYVAGGRPESTVDSQSEALRTVPDHETGHRGAT